ncbi:MAG: hypothetical protein KKF58_00285 [Gammaproteobacteria bacterium]|nr:hypothetical protein [Gammaproteobacteria bacterium]MBU1446723.1 hypothetical protein [Gammaproteobacteria bacterium]
MPFEILPLLRYACCALACSMFVQTASAQQMAEDFEIHSLYESWHLPANESMGVFALGLRKRFGDYAAIGLDFYDAIEGQRGGFITLGVSGAIEYPISDRWLAEAGLHLGAGGGNGGYLLTGGGLMLRESLGVKYMLTRSDAVSLGVSHVDFPEGGKIRSDQFYFSYHRTFKGLFREGQPLFDDDELPAQYLDVHGAGYHQLAVILRNVAVPNSVQRLGGLPQSDLQQMGIEWKSYLDADSFFRAETVGAMGGSSSGYMHVMAGYGREYVLADGLCAEASLSLGGGGGGAVDTGGGWLSEIAVGLRKNIYKDWFLKASVGRFNAPHGNFTGTGYVLGVGRAFGEPMSQDYRPQSAAHVEYHPIRIRATQQTYYGRGNKWRNRPDQNVGNLGMQLDYFVAPQVFLTGQGLAAYSGDAGAYMTGLVGMGLHTPFWNDWFVEAEGLVGAAGGGGLAVGSGLVRQFNLGVGYQISDALAIQAGVGDMKAIDGLFAASSVSLSLNYSFNLLSLKY